MAFPLAFGILNQEMRFPDLHNQLGFVRAIIDQVSDRTDLLQASLAVRGLREEFGNEIQHFFREIVAQVEQHQSNLLTIDEQAVQMSRYHFAPQQPQGPPAWIDRILSARRSIVTMLGLRTRSRSSSEDNAGVMGPFRPPNGSPLQRMLAMFMKSNTAVSDPIESLPSETKLDNASTSPQSPPGETLGDLQYEDRGLTSSSAFYQEELVPLPHHEFCLAVVPPSTRGSFEETLGMVEDPDYEESGLTSLIAVDEERLMPLAPKGSHSTIIRARTRDSITKGFSTTEGSEHEDRNLSTSGSHAEALTPLLTPIPHFQFEESASRVLSAATIEIMPDSPSVFFRHLRRLSEHFQSPLPASADAQISPSPSLRSNIPSSASSDTHPSISLDMPFDIPCDWRIKSKSLLKAKEKSWSRNPLRYRTRAESSLESWPGLNIDPVRAEPSKVENSKHSIGSGSGPNSHSSTAYKSQPWTFVSQRMDRTVSQASGSSGFSSMIEQEFVKTQQPGVTKFITPDLQPANRRAPNVSTGSTSVSEALNQDHKGPGRHAGEPFQGYNAACNRRRWNIYNVLSDHGDIAKSERSSNGTPSSDSSDNSLNSDSRIPSSCFSALWEEPEQSRGYKPDRLYLSGDNGGDVPCYGRQIDQKLTAQPIPGKGSSLIEEDIPWETVTHLLGQDLLDEMASNVADLAQSAELVKQMMKLKELPSEKKYFHQFISSRGNEYFCEIDEDYLTDRFNLTGLNTEVQYYQYALDLVTDVFDVDCDDAMREAIEKSARHLYGLAHARYIVTTRGLQKMMEKYKKSDFGKCPRVACDGQSLLPMGQNDIANISAVKLYCARCEDLYNPKSTRHANVDGAYFGTSFHNILFQVYPHVLPPKSQRRYEPRIYGFRAHAAATLARWQHEHREAMKTKLKAQGQDTGFEAEEREEDLEESDEELDPGQDGIDDMFEGQGMAQVTR